MYFLQQKKRNDSVASRQQHYYAFRILLFIFMHLFSRFPVYRCIMHVPFLLSTNGNLILFFRALATSHATMYRVYVRRVFTFCSRLKNEVEVQVIHGSRYIRFDNRNQYPFHISLALFFSQILFSHPFDAHLDLVRSMTFNFVATTQVNPHFTAKIFPSSPVAEKKYERRKKRRAINDRFKRSN